MAQNDLYNIWRQIAKGSVDLANRLEGEFHERFAALGRMPRQGHTRWDMTPIRIMAVLRGKRNVKRLLHQQSEGTCRRRRLPSQLKFNTASDQTHCRPEFSSDFCENRNWNRQESYSPLAVKHRLPKSETGGSEAKGEVRGGRNGCASDAGTAEGREVKRRIGYFSKKLSVFVNSIWPPLTAPLAAPLVLTTDNIQCTV